MADDLQLALLCTADEFQALRVEWDDLLRASRADSVFLTWDWMDVWWREFGRDAELRIWTARTVQDGRLMGVLPLVLRRGVFGALDYRELIPLGSAPSAADHLDAILRLGSEEAVGARLRQCLEETCGACDIVFMDGLVQHSEVFGPWIASHPRWAVYEERVPCPRFHLPGSWEAFLATLSKHERASFGRCARKLEQDFPGRAVHREVTTEADLEWGLSALMRLHQSLQQGQGHPGAFADPQVASFHRGIAQRFLERGRLYLSVLAVDGKAVAADYAFTYGGVWSDFATGYDRSMLQYGPGRQVLARAIQSAIAHGACVYDLLRGDEPYKLVLAPLLRHTRNVRVATNSRGACVLGAYRTSRRTRRLWRRLRGHAARAAGLLRLRR